MVECLLAKEDVASSSLVSRSIKKIKKPLRLFFVSGVYVMKQMQKYLYFALLALFFLLGLTLRAKLYIASNVFSDDECRLVVRYDGESRPAALTSGEAGVRLL